MNKISRRIRTIRAYRNYTQEFMAEELGISQSTYSRIESGAIKPDVLRLQQIAELLSIDLDYLINEHDTGSILNYVGAPRKARRR